MCGLSEFPCGIVRYDQKKVCLLDMPMPEVSHSSCPWKAGGLVDGARRSRVWVTLCSDGSLHVLASGVLGVAEPAAATLTSRVLFT